MYDQLVYYIHGISNRIEQNTVEQNKLEQNRKEFICENKQNALEILFTLCKNDFNRNQSICNVKIQIRFKFAP